MSKDETNEAQIKWYEAMLTRYMEISKKSGIRFLFAGRHDRPDTRQTRRTLQEKEKVKTRLSLRGEPQKKQNGEKDMDKTLKEAKELIVELKGLMGKFDEQSVARQDEISYWFRDHRTPETEEIFKEFMSNGLNEILVGVEDLRRQFKDEDYRLLPIGVIANEYFGKSRSWLSQRINGTKVRGRVYTLNAEQKAVFNRAVKEIGNKIGSFQIA